MQQSVYPPTNTHHLSPNQTRQRCLSVPQLHCYQRLRRRGQAPSVITLIQPPCVGVFSLLYYSSTDGFPRRLVHIPESFQFKFSVPPPQPTKDTLQPDSNLEREPLVASVPSKSRCPAQPESDAFSQQTLKPRQRSTGEIVLPDYAPPASIQQPALSATPASLSETPAKQSSLVGHDSDIAPSCGCFLALFTISALMIFP